MIRMGGMDGRDERPQISGLKRRVPVRSHGKDISGVKEAILRSREDLEGISLTELWKLGFQAEIRSCTLLLQDGPLTTLLAEMATPIPVIRQLRSFPEQIC